MLTCNGGGDMPGSEATRCSLKPHETKRKISGESGAVRPACIVQRSTTRPCVLCYLRLSCIGNYGRKTRERHTIVLEPGAPATPDTHELSLPYVIS